MLTSMQEPECITFLLGINDSIIPIKIIHNIFFF